MNKHYNDMIYSNAHLEHHGVQGQKWGVQNGPPYPLGNEVAGTLSKGEYKSLKSALKKEYYKNMDAAQSKYIRDTQTERDARQARDSKINTAAGIAKIGADHISNNNTKEAVKDITDAAKTAALTNSRNEFYKNTQKERDELNSTQDALISQYKSDKTALKEQYKAGKEGMSDTTKKILIAAGATAAVAAAGFVAYKAIDNKSADYQIGQRYLRRNAETNLTDAHRYSKLSKETAEVSENAERNAKIDKKWYDETGGLTYKNMYDTESKIAQSNKNASNEYKSKADKAAGLYAHYQTQYENGQNSKAGKASQKWENTFHGKTTGSTIKRSSQLDDREYKNARKEAKKK